MPLVIKDKEGKRSPHLALTHKELQGGSANGRNVSLLMKNKEQLTDEVIKALESLGINSKELNKAAFYSEIRTSLQTILKEKYADKDEWLYVEDFNDSVVIFCNNRGIFSVDYSYVNGEITVGDLANPVVSVLKYEPTSGKMLLSEDAEDKLEEGVYSLVTKALDNQESVEHFKNVFKSIEERKITLEKEIQKAVEEAQAVLKAQLVEKEEALQKALEKLAEIEKAQKEAVEKARKDKLKEVVGDEAEELFKAIGELPEQAFAAVVATIEKKAQVEKESDLFKEKGVSGEGDAPKQEEAGLALVGELIKKSKKQ